MKLEENIARIEIELADIKKQLEQQEKLELKGGNGYALLTRNKPETYSSFTNQDEIIQRGAFRATKELAEIADKNMVARNILEAYAMQVEPKWRDDDNFAYSIAIDYDTHTYRVSDHERVRIIGTVYMSKETAEILCKALNAGEITLLFKHRGVSWSKTKNKWIGQICVNKKHTYLGSSDSKEEVAEMYNNYIQDNNLEHTQNVIGEIEL